VFSCKNNAAWHNVLARELRILTAVDTLTLHIVQTDFCFGIGFPTYWRGLTDLTISGRFGAGYQEDIEFICSFPLLQRLVLHHEGVYPQMVTTNFIPELCVAKSLRALHFHHTTESDFLQWLSSCTSLPPISTLHLSNLSNPQCRAAGALLRRLGSSLENLELGLQTRFGAYEGPYRSF
jgi:hypothetical protein